MDGDTVMLAEQATLGSLLLDPVLIDRVRGWLRPGDFGEWWHGQVYTVLLERWVAGQPVDVEALAQTMVDRLGERSGGRLRIVDLLHTAPGHPVTATYARMVVEASLRREIAGQGVLASGGCTSVRTVSERRSAGLGLPHGGHHAGVDRRALG